MINGSVTVTDAVRLLNEVLALDPDAMNQLISSRVPCNESLADHPTIQVHGDPVSVGLLGFLNGLFGTLDNGFGPIMAFYDENDRLRKFGYTADFLNSGKEKTNESQAPSSDSVPQEGQ